MSWVGFDAWTVMGAQWCVVSLYLHRPEDGCQSCRVSCLVVLYIP